MFNTVDLYLAKVLFVTQRGNYYLATTEGDQPRVRPFGSLALLRESSIFRQGKSRASPSRWSPHTSLYFTRSFARLSFDKTHLDEELLFSYSFLV
jgi:hypothetical protein